MSKILAPVFSVGILLTLGMLPVKHHAAQTLILPIHTPGAYNRAVTQATLQKTVCARGYSTRIRPPSSYTSSVKRHQLLVWDNYTDKTPSHYEEDHFLPLSLGGAPRSTRNLWPEPWKEADKSDPIELTLWHKLCRGDITLRQARAEIRKFKRTNG